MEEDLVLEYITESKNLSFLYDPKSYYNQLCSMIRNAKETVVISCLYIGTLPLEQDFVNCIFEAKENNPNLVVELLLDKQRSMRKENTGKCILDLIKPLLSQNNVSLRLYHSPLCDPLLNGILKPPYSEILGTLHMKIYVADSVTVISGANCSTPYFTNRMDRYMIVNDQLFANLMHTIVKTVGTMAYKTTENLEFVWDSDLINPLDDSFLFKKQIYRRFVTMIKMCNDALEPILMAKVFANISSEQKKSKSAKIFNKLVQRRKSITSSGSGLSSQSVSHENFDFSNRDSFDYYTPRDVNENESLEEPCIKESLSGLYSLTPRSYLTLSKNSSINSWRYMNGSAKSGRNLNGVKTMRHNGKHEYCSICNNYTGTVLDDIDHTPYRIMRRYPPMEGFTRFMIFFQLGFTDPPFRQDEELCKDLMIKFRKSGHSLVLATSYLNFTKEYSDLVTYMLNCKSSENMGSFYVLTSSPTANDFHNCSDSKKIIPKLYCHYQNLLLDYVFKRSPRDYKDKEEEENDSFYYEYHNPGYTFHHKGIWAFQGELPKNAKELTFEEFKKNIKGPCAMLIGSSNLSRRSHNKDLEMNILVETNSVSVLDPIKYEIYALFSNATPVQKRNLCNKWCKKVMIYVFHLLLVYVYKFQAETVSLNFKNICFIYFNNISPETCQLKATSGEIVDFNVIESPSDHIIDERFFNISENPKYNGKNKENLDKLKWATFEARRFTYKLGKFNKKLRKVKNRRKLIYSNFDVDENELKKINIESRDINKSIQTFRALRKSFLNFIRGLRLNNNPEVPYVPVSLRSDKISDKYYQLANKPNLKRSKRIGDNKGVKNKTKIKRDKSGVEKKHKDNENLEFLRLLEEIKARR
uniref:Phosphatidylglycerophosphate synthase, putative n=1 Tax=Theileria annulata TaxID=5874 RepID=A0A3B0MHS9_THEAN